jgi:UDP-N-acetyl-D-glucosamine dehydrogenase
MWLVSTTTHKTLAIVGLGYAGLPLVMAAVDAGWYVIGIDASESRVNQIRSGSSPIEDVRDSDLKRVIENGTFAASCHFNQISNASVIVICVPTPLDVNREPDLEMLCNAVTAISPHLSNESLLISESTSFPGTLRNVIIPIVESSKSKEAERIYFGSAPERVNPNDPIWNQRNTPRLVAGIDSDSKIRSVEFYRSICDVVVPVSSPEIAEAAKLLENTYRLVNIALVNEFAQICHKEGISANEVVDAASTKPYGYAPFRPGVGVGGHCIPIDPMYLNWWAKQSGSEMELIREADSINRFMPSYVAKRVLQLCNSSRTPRILILGVAYKSRLSDIRETPTSMLREHLLQHGAIVAWSDPLVQEFEGTVQVENNWERDAVVVATYQPGVDIEVFLKKGIPILDCTNTFSNSKGVTHL